MCTTISPIWSQFSIVSLIENPAFDVGPFLKNKNAYQNTSLRGFCSNRDATLTKLNHCMCSSFAIVLSGKESSFFGDAHPTAGGVISS